MNINLGSIEQKILNEERLSGQEGLYLFEQADLLWLGMMANHVRRRKHPQRKVTYIIDRNINYTNVCVASCNFCAFYEKVGGEKAYVLNNDEIASKIEETIALGGTQVLMQGGLNPALKIDYYEELFNFIRSNFPGIRIHSLSPSEIAYVAKISKLTLEETIRRMHEAGLASIPGGGAEILVDRVRKVLNANKTRTDDWLEVMATAHRMGLKTTATMMFGHVETLSERIEHFLRLRQLQDQTGGFTAFIPWTYQPENTELGGEKTSAHDYLRTLAISRLMLDNVPNLQVSWVTMGDKIAQVALEFGGNDFGSLMIEENVVSAAGANFRLSLEQIRRLISDAGYEPHQRDMEYNLLN